MSKTLLTYKSLQQSVNSLASLVLSKDDLRKVARVTLRGQTQIWININKIVKDHLVALRDISMKGVGFVARKEFKTGSIVVVEFPLENGGKMNMPCRLVHTGHSAGDLFLYGAQFSRPLVLDPSATPALKLPAETAKPFEEPKADAEVERIRKAMFDQ